MKLELTESQILRLKENLGTSIVYNPKEINEDNEDEPNIPDEVLKRYKQEVNVEKWRVDEYLTQKRNEILHFNLIDALTSPHIIDELQDELEDASERNHNYVNKLYDFCDKWHWMETPEPVREIQVSRSDLDNYTYHIDDLVECCELLKDIITKIKRTL